MVLFSFMFSTEFAPSTNTIVAPADSTLNLVGHFGNMLEKSTGFYIIGNGEKLTVAGVGVNYQQAGNIVLAPKRTGVGQRAGANVGYLSYTRKPSVIPF